jgi:hypothetical protein
VFFQLIAPTVITVNGVSAAQASSGLHNLDSFLYNRFRRTNNFIFVVLDEL